MGNYEQLKQAVSSVIKNNGNMEITGDILQNTLLSIISTVGGNATFAGIATPSTNPGTPDQNVFYIASENGTYSNFGGVTLDNKVVIFSNANGSWEMTDTGIATELIVSELFNDIEKVKGSIIPLSKDNIQPSFGKQKEFPKDKMQYSTQQQYATLILTIDFYCDAILVGNYRSIETIKVDGVEYTDYYIFEDYCYIKINKKCTLELKIIAKSELGAQSIVGISYICNNMSNSDFNLFNSSLSYKEYTLPLQQGAFERNGTRIVESNKLVTTQSLKLNSYLNIKDKNNEKICISIDNIEEHGLAFILRYNNTSPYVNQTKPFINNSVILDLDFLQYSELRFAIEIYRQDKSDILISDISNITIKIMKYPKFIGADDFGLQGQYVECLSPYIPQSAINMANVCMQCDLRTFKVSDLSAKSSAMFSLVSHTTKYGQNNSEYKKVIKGLPGYGVKFNGATNIALPCYAENNYLLSNELKHQLNIGFWVRMSDYLDGESLKITEGSGVSYLLPKETLLQAKFTDVFRNVIIETQCFGQFTFVELIFNKGVVFNGIRYRMSLSKQNSLGEIQDTIYIHNFTSIYGDYDGLRIQPYTYYKTLPDLYNSNLIGKVLCFTGDSNGGGGVGTDKRLSWAAEYLGMPMIDASNGGWAMQARLLNAESSYYGWLYYHKWREKIIATNADIYYFNQCTNDGNSGEDATFNENDNRWYSNNAEKFGRLQKTGDVYQIKDNGTYGMYGDGTYDCVKDVFTVYTDEFKQLLEQGNLNAMYKGKTLLYWCRKYMTTIGCTAAFIAEIQEKQPNAICVIDTTIGSIGVCNALLGGFNASGIISTNKYETDENGYVTYSPYLKSEEDGNGLPQSYIDNGTINGGQAVTEINESSSLDDGNNYNLFCYYAYKDYKKSFNQLSELSKEQIDVICLKCHQFYENNSGIYGRINPLNLYKVRPDITYATSLNRLYYIKSVNTLQSWMRIPFIKAGENTNINMWNVKIIAADAGHWNKKGMERLGIPIADYLNSLLLKKYDNTNL